MDRLHLVEVAVCLIMFIIITFLLLLECEMMGSQSEMCENGTYYNETLVSSVTVL
jgi:hypothetical protein